MTPYKLVSFLMRSQSPFPKAEGKSRVKFCVQINLCLKILLHLFPLLSDSLVLQSAIVIIISLSEWVD